MKPVLLKWGKQELYFQRSIRWLYMGIIGGMLLIVALPIGGIVISVFFIEEIGRWWKENNNMADQNLTNQERAAQSKREEREIFKGQSCEQWIDFKTPIEENKGRQSRKKEKILLIQEEEISRVSRLGRLSSSERTWLQPIWERKVRRAAKKAVTYGFISKEEGNSKEWLFDHGISEGKEITEKIAKVIKKWALEEWKAMAREVSVWRRWAKDVASCPGEFVTKGKVSYAFNSINF